MHLRFIWCERQRPVSGLTWLQLSTMIRFLLWRRKWVLSAFPNSSLFSWLL